MQRDDEPKPGFLGSTYTALRRIDRGFGAEVWKAIRNGPAGFAKLLALKKVRPEVAASSSFVKEMSVVAHLVHPNVVQVLDFEQVEDDCFLAMEYVPGCDLGHLLAGLRARGEELSTHESLYVVLEIVRGLRALHERAPDPETILLHRGLAPDNVLLSWHADVKLTDFCKAQSLDPDDTQLRDRLAWMSPEQAGASPLDERSDLFAAALVLFALLSGRRLFTGESVDELVWRIVSYEGLTLEDLEDVPLELRAFLSTALQPDPADRFANARELEAALIPFLSASDAARARASLAIRLGTLLNAERCGEDASRETDPDPDVEAERTAPSPVNGDRVEEPTSRMPGEAVEATVAAFREPPRSYRAELIAVLFLAVAGLFVSEYRAESDEQLPPPSAMAGVGTAGGPASAPAEDPRRGMARLSITSRKWVEVWIDGKRIGKGTPVRSMPVSAGRHVLRVINPEIGLILETTVFLTADREKKLVVDAAAGGLKEIP